MTGFLAFDLVRLFVGPLTPVPRGIDRVELAYARHFFEQQSGDCAGILPTPWGVRWFNRERSLRLVNFIEGYWGEAKDTEADAAYGVLKDKLLGRQPSVVRPNEPPGAFRLAGGVARLVRQAGFSLGHRIAGLPAGAVYLNTGQIGLAVSKLLTWLAARPDIKPVFMLHDAIPLENPEFTASFSIRAHRQMLVSTIRYARGLIVTTEAARTSIKRELVRLGGADIATIAAPLPVPAAFLERVPTDPELDGVAYFVICGAIEPRKNHRLLLNVWRDLIAHHGQHCPKLVIVGSRWRTTEDVVDLLENCAALKGSIVEVAGLSTPALRQVIIGARALLMPSFAEGFGLPIIEALALGTPVVASDLASHREAGASFATYVSPHDQAGWLAAIQSLSSAGFHSVRDRLAGYRPQTSAEYFHRIEQFIDAL
jgi:glycosyltransferase involved in cell wall biosynthesis